MNKHNQQPANLVVVVVVVSARRAGPTRKGAAAAQSTSSLGAYHTDESPGLKLCVVLRLVVTLVLGPLVGYGGGAAAVVVVAVAECDGWWHVVEAAAAAVPLLLLLLLPLVHVLNSLTLSLTHTHSVTPSISPTHSFAIRSLTHICLPRFGAPQIRATNTSGPTTILVMSLTFIGFVILLHIFGKFR
jgi:hypothetical protein